jgi:thiosulfate/3-mercaptopyruvate sulfurtransferase
MLPSEAPFSAAATALGLQNDETIVVYDSKGIFSAARAWWLVTISAEHCFIVFDIVQCTR